MSNSEFLIGHLVGWTVCATICYGLFTLVRFYWNLRKYPKGPMPMPILGNIHYYFLTQEYDGENPAVLLDQAKEIYGSVFTFWCGLSMPVVFITDPELVKRAFRTKEFAGRRFETLELALTQGRGKDVLLRDFGPEWVNLRRVAHASVRNYSMTEHLAQIVNETVEETVKTIKKREGIDNPFVVTDYIYLAIINIIAASIFGKRYSIDDEEFKYIKINFEQAQKNFEIVGFIDGFTRFLRWIIMSVFKRPFVIIDNMTSLFKIKYQEQVVKNTNNDIDWNITKMLLSAKETASKKGLVDDLVDENLGNVIVDLFAAGVDTTQYTLQWIFLLMSNYPDMQQKMRQEIAEVIGDRRPIQGDLDHCPYVQAFISECLRFRTVLLIGVPHHTICDVEIGQHKIPKHTVVIAFNWSIHNNPEYWDKPDVFNPDRFLDKNGHYSAPDAFMPFGIGRRICLGQKMAWVDMFLVLVRTLQLTKGYLFEMPDGPGTADLTICPHSIFLCKPNPYKVVLKRSNE